MTAEENGRWRRCVEEGRRRRGHGDACQAEVGVVRAAAERVGGDSVTDSLLCLRNIGGRDRLTVPYRLQGIGMECRLGLRSEMSCMGVLGGQQELPQLQRMMIPMCRMDFRTAVRRGSKKLATVVEQPGNSSEKNRFDGKFDTLHDET